MEVTEVLNYSIGLGGIVISFYSIYTNFKSKKFELELKDKHFKNDRKNQISKEKYQYFFGERIDLYRHLQKIIYKYHLSLTNKNSLFLENNKLNSLTAENIFKELIQSIDDVLSLNQFFLSNELTDLYKKIIITHNKTMNNHYRNMDVHNFGQVEMEKMYTQSLLKSYKLTHKNIKKFICLLEDEIKNIKINIGFDN